MKAVIYKRVSTNKQKDNYSLEFQSKECYKYAKQKKLTVIAELSDIRSGLKSCTFESQLKSLEYDVLLLFKLDRLTRNDKNLVTELESKGVKIISIHDQDKTKNELIDIANIELDNMKIRTTLGKKYKALSGGYIGGSPKLGKQAINKELVINQDEQNLIRVIKYHRNKGKSLREICKLLDDKGYKTKRGGKWYPKTIANITG